MRCLFCGSKLRYYYNSTYMQDWWVCDAMFCKLWYITFDRMDKGIELSLDIQDTHRFFFGLEGWLACGWKELS